MISSCANPACNRPFHYLRRGRLYRFDAPCGRELSEDVSNAVSSINSRSCAVFFWLCKDCSSKFSLKFNGRKVSVTPLEREFRRYIRNTVVASGEWKTGDDQVPTELKTTSGGSSPAMPPALNPR